MSSWLDSQNLDLMAVPFRIGSMPFEMYQKMLGTQRRLMTMGDLLELGWRSHSRVMNPLPPELQEEISQSFAHVWEDGLLLATRQTGREIQYGQEPDQVATLDRVYTPGSLVEMRESYFNLMTGREKKGKVMSMANDSLQRLTSTPLEAEALFATGTQTEGFACAYVENGRLVLGYATQQRGKHLASVPIIRELPGPDTMRDLLVEVLQLIPPVDPRE